MCGCGEGKWGEMGLWEGKFPRLIQMENAVFQRCAE